MTVELKVPELGESVTEVRIGAWRKEPGERVQRDEILLELESDKATLEYPAPQAGVLVEQRLATGAEARVGDVFGLLDDAAPAPTDDATPPAAPAASQARAGPVPAKAPAAVPAKAPAAVPAKAPAAVPAKAPAAVPAKAPAAAPARVTPSARRLLREHGIAPESVAAGDGGRVGRADAQALVDAGGAGSLGGRREERVRMSPLRRTIAERLVRAQQEAALLTTFNEIDMTRVIGIRTTRGERFQERHGVKLGFMSFFARAVVEALKAHPGLNARVDGDEIVYRDYVDLGIAVGSGKGLVVPVLRDAQALGFAEVEHAVRDFAERAQANALQLEELQGGTFTISNGGVYGSLLSTPIVNPPQSGILGLHAIQKRPVEHEGAIALRPMMYVALTYDHRVVDGREAVTFLRRVKQAVEDPVEILLEL